MTVTGTRSGEAQPAEGTPTERALARQIARMSAMSRFAMQLSPTLSEEEILRLAGELVGSLFSFSQFLGFLTNDAGRLALVAAGGQPVPQREDVGLARVVTLRHVAIGAEPLLGVARDIACGHPEWADLLALVAVAVGAPAPPDHDPRELLLVPLATGEGATLGALVFRRGVAVGEPLPTASDGPFLKLIAQQVAAAIRHARLLAELTLRSELLAQAQRESIDRERLAALGELAAVVAHEVRNPVAVIFNSVASLERLIDGPGTATSLLGIVREEAERLSHMVSDLLDFSRPSAPQLRDEPLRSIVADAAGALRNTSIGAALAIEIAGDHEVLARCDARMIRQVMVNLLLNAHEASLGLGPVKVELEERSASGERSVEIRVSDCGAGIEPGGIERLFQPFFTTKPRGTGLGLAIVKRFVELHGGSVGVSSAAGSGTTFRVTWPSPVDPDQRDTTRSA